MQMNDIKKNWTREETMLAFELYCTIPAGHDTIHNKNIINLSKVLKRSVNSVKLKLQNFKSYDPSYTQNGRVGLSHGSKLDEEICLEFFQNWDNLIVETNDIKKRLGLSNSNEEEINEVVMPVGYDKVKMRKERIGQAFFRQTLLAIYNNKCCFTGIDIPELLKASHIKPWSESNNINEKTNPRNGLLLNALHDIAFDKGYITISFDYKIIVSKELLAENDKNYFAKINGQKMLLPSKFLPDRNFIEYHNNKFRG
jgi:putative restriction endonuclease